MTVTELTHAGVAAGGWRRVRWELFVFDDVRDVLPSAEADAVRVVHRGPARVGEWSAALDAAATLDGQPAREPAA